MAGLVQSMGLSVRHGVARLLNALMSLNDPQWGKRPGSGNQGPPDLDEVWRNFQKKFGGLFGKRGSPPGGDSGTPMVSIVRIPPRTSMLARSVDPVKSSPMQPSSTSAFLSSIGFDHDGRRFVHCRIAGFPAHRRRARRDGAHSHCRMNRTAALARPERFPAAPPAVTGRASDPWPRNNGGRGPAIDRRWDDSPSPRRPPSATGWGACARCT